MYGDVHCKLLTYEDIIDYSGICNMHTAAAGVINDTEEQVIEEAEEYVETGTCVTCDHSYMLNDVPMCDVDTSEITDTNSRCAAFSEE